MSAVKNALIGLAEQVETMTGWTWERCWERVDAASQAGVAYDRIVTVVTNPSTIFYTPQAEPTPGLEGMLERGEISHRRYHALQAA